MDLSLSRKGDEATELVGGRSTNEVIIEEVTNEVESSSDINIVESSTTPFQDDSIHTNSSSQFSPNQSLNLSNKRSREDDDDDDIIVEVNGSSESSAPPAASRRRLSNDSDAVNKLNNDTKPRVNGLTNGYSSDGPDVTATIKNSDGGESEEERIKSPPIKDLSPEELAHKMKMVQRLQVELRNEEMKLVLLKKLRQSQMIKEPVTTPNDAKAALAQLPSNTTATKLPASHPPPPPYRQDLSAKASASPIPAHFKASREYKQAVKAQSKAFSSENLTIQAQKLLKDRGTILSSPLANNKSSISLTSSSCNLSALNALNNSISSTVDKVAASSSTISNINATVSVATSSNGERNLSNKLSLPFNLSRDVEIIRKDSPSASSSPGPRDSPSQVSISKVRPSIHSTSSLTTSSTSPFPNKPSSSSHVSSSHRDDGQSPAQRQAAARLALRKQLEKTLLRIPPPKPPPPEMQFIPNPSNTEFIYLLGLEQCVEYILHHSVTDPKPTPFICTQCGTDFTPSWKWDRSKHKQYRNDTATKVDEPKVVCDQCVTNNMKQTLKQEHTNRLKAAFMKALQQEQEIETRLAQVRPTQVRQSPQLQPELNHGVSLTVVSSASTSSRLPASVSVTAVKNDYAQQQHLTHRSTSVAAQLHLQRERERHKEQERQREREERERQRQLDRESREREREREREQREQQRKEEMFLPPGLSKQQKEQFLQNMNAAAAMAAMTNPAALQQIQAAQAQLLRMQQGMGGSVAAAAAAAQQIPAAHMLAPYLLGPYNPFGLQQLQQLMAAQMGAAVQQANSSSVVGNERAAGGSSSSSSSSSSSKNLQQHQDLLRQAAEMQRQYFLDMIPPAGLHNQQQSHSKWKS